MPEQQRPRIERAESNEKQQRNQYQPECKSKMTFHHVRVEIPDAPRLVSRQSDEFASEKQLMQLVAQISRQPRKIGECRR
jgi:hypothetical protein